MLIKQSNNQTIKEILASDSARIAFDKETVREMDRDGRMRVSIANISKATVNPYKGHEIPDWEALGLDPNKVYYLLRDPEELEKAAPSFNGVQILRKHTPVSAEDHQPWEVVGSTGTNAEFDGTFLRNSLSIWAEDAIGDIESDAKKELSCGYHYTADMTPGSFNGMRFDGVMRDIVGNHVALVEDGRAGPDVVVGDSNQEIAMSTERKIKAIAHRTVSIQALTKYLRPRLAQDAKAKPLGIAMAFDGVTGVNWKAKKPEMAKAIRTIVKSKLAKDASLEDVEKILDMLDGHEIGSGDAEVSEAENKAIETASQAISEIEPPQSVGKEFADADKGKTFDAEGFRNFLSGKGMDEESINGAMDMIPKNAVDAFPADLEKGKGKEEPKAEDEKDDDDEEKKKKAEEAKGKDEFPPKEKDKDMAAKDSVSKPAMDAAIKVASDTVRKEVRAQERAIRAAEKAVQPYVGVLDMAFDSAEEVYRHALEAKGVETKGIHESAFPALLKMLPKAGAQPSTSPMAADAASVKGFNERFPQAARIQNV